MARKFVSVKLSDSSAARNEIFFDRDPDHLVFNPDLDSNGEVAMGAGEEMILAWNPAVKFHITRGRLVVLEELEAPAEVPDLQGFDPGDFPIAEIGPKIEGAPVEVLESILELEIAGKGRAGAIDVIEAALGLEPESPAEPESPESE